MVKVYLEPVALLYGKAASEAVASGAALPLAGGPVAFAGVRIWEGEPGAVTHAIARTVTLQAIEDSAVKEALERLTAPRASLMGLSLDRPRLMGIINVTPDSFSDGGDYLTPEAALQRARKALDEGADILDIGGESTRPGASPVSEEEELSRVLPVIQGLAPLKMPLSIDTTKPAVMEKAVAAGASIVNDVSGLTQFADSMASVARLKVPVIIMHRKGDPATMQDDPTYKDVVIEVYDYLHERIEAAVAAGIPRNFIVADPGIGFGKTADHNIELLQAFGLFHGLGVPLMVGASRKRFIEVFGGKARPKDRVGGSITAAVSAVAKGVQLVRAHDVFATSQALKLWSQLQFGGPGVVL